jgi:hypothetical protein
MCFLRTLFLAGVRVRQRHREPLHALAGLGKIEVIILLRYFELLASLNE